MHRLRRLHRRLRRRDGQDGLPAGLIRYSTENGVARAGRRSADAARVLRPRVLIYGACCGGERRLRRQPPRCARASRRRGRHHPESPQRGGVARRARRRATWQVENRGLLPPDALRGKSTPIEFELRTLGADGSFNPRRPGTDIT
jgi:hypothetical protein